MSQFKPRWELEALWHFFFFFGNYSWEMALLKELVLMVFSVQFSELTLEIWIKLQILDVYFIKI